MKSYDDFLSEKLTYDNQVGFDVNPNEINPILFDFQRDIVVWSLRLGKSAIFADCGLGKTFMQLEWARQILANRGKNVLIIAPLAVSRQTKLEGEKIDISVNIASSMDDIVGGINITNYEKIHKFELSRFDAIVLDESSILKSFSGKYKKALIEKSRGIKYKLACTATPAPNDYMELGNHAEFLEIMTRDQMLAMFFIHDGSETQKWRLKGHGKKRFWEWITDWAVMIRKPSDLGYNDNGFILPELQVNEHILHTEKRLDGELFVSVARTLKERQYARRSTISERACVAAKIINESAEPWIVWCNLNDESRALSEIINQSVEISGSDNDTKKESVMIGFKDGDPLRLITKPKIAGFGMNWQHCNNIMFVGLSDSYEQYYQAVRRCWRFGQEREVNVHIVVSDQEGSVLGNIKRKEHDANEMATGMVKNMKELTSIKIKDIEKKEQPTKTHLTETDEYKLYLGDSVKIINQINDESIHLAVFSPPFASLYTYSDSKNDMGNSSYSEFWDHFGYLIDGLYRVMIPGRIVAIHCMNLSKTISSDGVLGVRDFRGDIIRSFESKDFIYHSEIVIWKDPLVQAVRTKALTLAHKQISKDASRCAQGLPDYIVVMRKAGENPSPVEKGRGFERYIGEKETPAESLKTDNPRTNKFSHKVWQRYASPVWMDIRQTRVLNYSEAREEQDEKHVCPLQLDTIERIVELWSNPGETTLDPFNGIGSTGYISILNNRKYIGIELKESYYNQSIKNLAIAKSDRSQGELFS